MWKNTDCGYTEILIQLRDRVLRVSNFFIITIQTITIIIIIPQSTANTPPSIQARQENIAGRAYNR